MKPHRLTLSLLLITALLLCLGLVIGSSNHSLQQLWNDPTGWQILWQIRAPRSLGTWLVGALLGLSGAVAQGLFRNPLADPYLMGCSSGASLGVVCLLALTGNSSMAAAVELRLGLTGVAFLGSVLAVLLTLILARGVEHTLRLLLAGVIVGVVLGSLASLITLGVPELLRSVQVFMLGTTGLLGWSAVAILLPVGLLCLAVATSAARALDAFSLGEATAISLGVPVTRIRMLMIACLALSTGAAVAQAGLIAFVGLLAPHLVRSRVMVTHASLVLLSALTGGSLLLAADVVARVVIAPQELPVGVLTAFLGGAYLLWLMWRKPSASMRGTS